MSKYKLVISGGDSFTFGSELHNENEDPSVPHHESWANLVALELGEKHLNLARHGRSNSYIVRHIIDCLAKTTVNPKDILVQVMWTFVDRYEYALEYDTGEYDTPWYPFSINSAFDETNSDWFKSLPRETKNWESTYKSLRLKWKKNVNLGVVDFSKQYNRVVMMNPLNHSYSSAKDVLFLQNYLDLNKIDYMFTYVNNYVTDGLKTQAQDHPGSSYLESIRKLIHWDKWYEFPGNTTMSGFGFDNWSKQNNYEYATSHPLHNAHKDAARLIVDFLK
jgi:hypothetical protein